MEEKFQSVGKIPIEIVIYGQIDQWDIGFD
jgi:hypothetical protein